MIRLVLAFILCALLGLAVNRLLSWLVYKAVEFMVWLM